LRAFVRKWTARLLPAVFGIAVGLLLAELCVRLVMPQPALQVPDALYAPDPPDLFGLRAGFSGTITNRTEFSTEVHVDSLGLRGPEPGAPGAAGLRLLALGDSFAFGVGVEADQTFVRRLAQMLTDQGTPAEGLNAGVPGYGPAEAAAWLERHGLALQPDLVLWAIYLGNDLQDADPASERAQIVDGFVRRGHGGDSAADWLYVHSQLFVLVKRAVPAAWHSRLRAALGLSEPSVTRNLRRELDIYRRQPTAWVVGAREACSDAVARLQAAASGSRVPVVALLVPAAVQLDDDLWRKALAQLGADPRDYAVDAPTRLFQSLLEARGIPTLDLTPALRAAREDGLEPYYAADMHWTPAGHELAARELATLIRERGLLMPERDTQPGP
jgi:hypothetical protein